MHGNKICLTQKGYDLLRDESKQFQIQRQLCFTQKVPSLPSLQSTVTNRSSESLGKKQIQNNKLSKLSGTLTKIQTIGVKKLTIKKEEKQLTKILSEQMRQKSPYLTRLIPTLVRKTRDGKLGNLNSKFNRGRAYAQRLMFNYSTQKNFGMRYNKRTKNNEEE